MYYLLPVRKNFCSSLVLLFSVFVNIVSKHKLGQYLSNLFFYCMLVGISLSLCFVSLCISCFKLMLASLGKSNLKIFGAVVITKLLSPIIIITWLNSFYFFTDFIMLIDILFAWCCILVCLHYLPLLFVLISLKVWLVVCLELRLSF